MPGISAYIHQRNLKLQNGAAKIPLAGMAIGDGWIDPVNMVPGDHATIISSPVDRILAAYPEMVYNFGMCDESEKAVIQVPPDHH